MLLAQFLTLLDAVTETKKGWDACCPAHDDRHPSLGILEGDEGKIVLNCFAGCTPASICAAVGLTVADLFQDRPLLAGPRPSLRHWKPLPPVKLAFAYEMHALDLRQQAEKIFTSAQHCADHDRWSHDDLDWAMKAVARGYAYLDWAVFCEGYADHLREGDYESRRLASCKP